MRNTDAPLLFETFLIAAVVSFLGIRAFLAATGYPRVGGGGLHIAHMLWGGLLMIVALGMLFLFLDRSIQRVAAVVAGIGFGTFVDEIGKFITSDNDYFFRPAVALIYVIFVALFLVARALTVSRRPSPTDALANALDLLEEHLGRTIEPDDRGRIAALLRQAPAVPSLRPPPGRVRRVFIVGKIGALQALASLSLPLMLATPAGRARAGLWSIKRPPTRAGTRRR